MVLLRPGRLWRRVGWRQTMAGIEKGFHDFGVTILPRYRMRERLGTEPAAGAELDV
jgi:hypothetical protein